ncbi:MAG: CDP-glucose 4,6-dehydratase [Rickettsia endosymbiont of Ixodes persulcatus]|nr:CDP-glucose 4,6-dehydratase [Rickettsia endosymbiont of Ixodes persulcatus]
MEFWQGKKVLLTGHTGFKGSWLSLWLQALGADLIGFSLSPPTLPNLFEIARVKKEMISVTGDIRDFSLLENTLKQYQPEIVIHMAAQSLVRYSYQEPLKTYATNVMGTANLLEAIRLKDLAKVVVNVTSDKCYENKEMARGYCETDRLGGYDPYSNSKACAELVTQAYRDSYFASKGIGIATVRAGNVIGGGDWAKDRLVPDVINACINQKTLLLRYPNALRPWQHVLEPLHGYLILAKHLYQSPEHYSGSWNFGPNEEDIKSVSWMVDSIMQRWPTKTNWQLAENSQPHESTLLTLDSTKAKLNLAWKPQWGIEQAVNKTVECYQVYCKKADEMKAKMLLQINEFMQDNSFRQSETLIAGSA